MENNNSHYNFALKTSDLSGIRYIKLDKKASYSENWNEIIERQKEEKQVNSDHLKTFYSFGFYDLLTCFQAIEPIDYMDHFHISPPFYNHRNTLKVEQWFGIFPVDQENTSTETNSEIIDPFFCGNALLHALPFLGVILISLNNLSGEFKEILGEFVKNIKLKITKRDAQNDDVRFVYKLYYSLNCADLCLVIRTDSLNYIHKINRTIERMAEEDNTEINTTVIFSVQDVVSKDDLIALDSKNKKVSFIVRSDKMYENYFGGKDKEAVDGAATALSFNGTSYGVNGTGKFVTKLNYKQYSEFLPDLIKYKLDLDYTDSKMVSPYVQGICHEREWFEEEPDSNAKKRIHKFHRKIFVDGYIMYEKKFKI